MRFRCLDRSGGTLQYSPQKVPAFFVACCVLHNISMNHGCVDDINEEILEDLRRRDVELRWDWTLRRNLVREKYAMRSWWSGWTEMEWGEEEGAQQVQVVRLEAHAPWLQQSSPDLRRCAREAAATSAPGQDGHLLLCRIPDSSRWRAPGKSAVIIAIRHGTSAPALKGNVR